MWRKKIVVVAVGAVLTTGLAGCADDSSNKDASGGSASATVVLSNESNQNYLPLILADRLGFFKKQGIDVKINQVQSNGQVTNALLAGQAQAMAGFYDHTCDLQAKGKQIESVISVAQAPGMVVMSRPGGGVSSASDLRNKTFGVVSLAGSSKYLADYLSDHNGVPSSEVHFTEVEAGPTFVAAFQHNRVDAGMTTEPTVSTLLKKHLAKVAVDMRTAAGTKAALGGPYPGTAIMVRSDWAKSHKATAQKMVNGLYEALQWMESHSAAQITSKVPADFYSGPGKEQYTQALANEMGMFNPTGQMPTDAPQAVAHVLNTVDPVVKGHKLDVSKTYTDAFVQKAAQSLKHSS